MKTHEIKAALGLPANLDSKRLASRALREHCAGGAELLDAKEWAAGIARTSRDEISAALGEEALVKLRAIEAALLTALEEAKELPRGSLTERI